MKKVGLMLSSALALALVASACGGAAAPTSTPTTKPAATAAAQPVATAPSAAQPTPTRPQATAPSPPTPAPTASGARVPQGSIVAAITTLQEQDPDPHRYTGGLVTPMVYSVADGLVRYDQLTRKVVGATAKSWTTTPDGLRYEFTLRNDVVFHNGQKMSADDVKFSFERSMRPELRHSSGGLMKRTIKSIDITAPDRIAFTLNTPNATFVATTGGFGMPVPKAYVGQVGDAGFEKAPVAAGPFKFTANSPLEYARFTAFEQHYERVPAFKTLEYRIVPEGSTRVAMLLTGEADIADGVSGPRMLQIKDQPNLQLIGAPLTAIFWIQLNALGKAGYEGPLKDIRVRRALNLAIDRQAIADKVYFGQALPAQVFFPSGIGSDTSLKPYPYDPDTAKKLLDEAGYGKGLSFTLGVTESASTPLSPETIQAVQGMWEKVGVKSTIVRQESGTYYLKWQAYNMDCELCGQSVPLIDDQWQYASFFFMTGASYYAYADDTTNRLLNTAGAEANPDKRAALVQELNRYLYNNYLSIPTHHVNTVYGARKGIEWRPIAGNPYMSGLEYLRVTAPRR